ncbi:hypothetical protein Syun_011697 [Stephania yunnanensis]|uniref:MYB transcription factor n=1 Tax=Stephania yunnanensis TaxID=152371 RepID=A0AAP0PFP7_9MAGN
MGAPKQKWTSEEEEALIAGVAKHGTGKWKNIQKDPEFGHCLAARSNIDLKDKWRNMSVSAGGSGSRDKVRAPKLKALPAPSPSTAQFPALVPVVVSPEACGTTSKIVADGKNASRPKESKGAENQSNSRTPAASSGRHLNSSSLLELAAHGRFTAMSYSYNAMIFEALSTLKDPYGSDIGAIIGFIEQKHVVPQNFRRLLSSKLRRLVGQEKLEKIQNCYKIKKDTSFGTKTPTPKQKEVRPRQPPQNSLVDAMEEAAATAAYKIADAENKAFLAAETVKDSERVAKMAVDSDSILRLFKEVLERCSRGEIVLIA